MPPAGKGRSRFVISALEEKLARAHSVEWKPKMQSGRRLAALLKKGRLERKPLLDSEEIARELIERRGRFH